jgi:hypothetical protein
LLKVYDILGREVATLAEGPKQAGTYTSIWNADGNASGVYMYNLTAGKYSVTKKLVLMR